MDAGASKSVLDLTDVRLRRLELHTGASETHVHLPRAAGATEFRAETGVAARIRVRMALGSTEVDVARFPRTADGYESTDYGIAPNRVEIDVQGGVGSVRIGGGA